jgi:hypothetical protein
VAGAVDRLAGGSLSRVDAPTIPCMRGPFHEPALRLELPGAHHPYLASDASARWWVLKPLQPRGILAEAMGGLLARALGVPIPEFGIFESDERGRGWLSEFVMGAQHFGAARAEGLADQADLGRMLALDAIVHNEDRNTENILFEPLAELGRFRGWVIDHEAALVARPRELASKGLGAPRPFALPSGFVADAEARRAALDTAVEAQRLPEAMVRAMVDVAAEVAGALDREILAHALVARCRHALQIVEHFLGDVPRG